MKIRLYLISALLMAFSGTAHAQVGDHRQDFAVGISGGYTMNTMSFSPTIKQFLKGSPEFGLTGRYICEKYFNSICGVQVELNYQNLGWKEAIDDNEYYGIQNNQYTRNLRFIEMPLLMQMGWGRERKGLKFLFEAGPYFNYYIGQSEQKDGDPWNESYRPNSVVYQYSHDIDNKVSYGIKAGIGAEWSSSIGHIMLEARYGYGLGDLYDSSKKGYFARSANQTIEVRLTYLFDIIKTNIDK